MLFHTVIRELFGIYNKAPKLGGWIDRGYLNPDSLWVYVVPDLGHFDQMSSCFVTYFFNNISDHIFLLSSQFNEQTNARLY